jgi:hypothetical protein
MLDKRIEFDERWDRDDGSTVLWFTAPKELLPGEYPDAESMELSLEFPTHNLYVEDAIVEFSPTKYNEDEGATDYDWQEIDIPIDEIEALIKLAEENGKI